MKLIIISDCSHIWIIIISSCHIAILDQWNFLIWSFYISRQIQITDQAACSMLKMFSTEITGK